MATKKDYELYSLRDKSRGGRVGGAAKANERVRKIPGF